jgi:hypothetical protein
MHQYHTCEVDDALVILHRGCILREHVQFPDGRQLVPLRGREAVGVGEVMLVELPGALVPTDCEVLRRYIERGGTGCVGEYKTAYNRRIFRRDRLTSSLRGLSFFA